jgi:anti-sigma factor RsiW
MPDEPCLYYQDRLADYFRGTLSEQEVADLERHAAVCDTCARAGAAIFALRQFEASAALEALARQAADPSLRQRVADWMAAVAAGAQAQARVVVGSRPSVAAAQAGPRSGWEFVPDLAPGALNGLRPATVLSPGTPAPETGAKPAFCVKALASGVLIMAVGLSPDAPLPLILIRGPETVASITLQAAPEIGGFHARFEHLGPGEYLVLIEPVRS